MKQITITADTKIIIQGSASPLRYETKIPDISIALKFNNEQQNKNYNLVGTSTGKLLLNKSV